MKNVYLISPKFSDYIGGMETHALEFAKYFSKSGNFRLKKIFSNKNVNDGISSNERIYKTSDEEYIIDGFKVKKILTSNFSSDAKLLIKEIEPDSVVFMNSPTWLPIIENLKENIIGLKVILRSGGNDLLAGWIGNENDKSLSLVESRKKLVNLVNSFVDCFIVNSKFSYNNFLEIGVEKKIMKIFQGGVDINLIKPVQKNSDEEFIILSTSRLVIFKGLIDSIRVISKVKEKTDKKIKYLIVGDGPEKNNILEEIDKLDLNDVVQITGSVSFENIVKYYNKADLYIQLSLYLIKNERGSTYVHTETMGRSLCEAAAAGIPSIANNLGGMKEVVNDKITGFLVEQSNYEDAANKILKLIEDKQLREKLGQNARKKAEEKFAWEILFKKYEELFVNIPIKIEVEIDQSRK